MSNFNIIKRAISTTCPHYGKHNFRKFMVPNKRGSRVFKQQQRENPDPDLLDKRGTRDTGYKVGDKFVVIPEMIPEIIVPDLKDFKLKAYVSYRAPDVAQTEFTARDLFDAIYANKISEDFKQQKLNEDYTAKEPSPEEKLTPEEAQNRARQTGSDLFKS